MSRLLIVVERMSDWGAYHPSENVIPALEYLRMPIGGEEPRTQVINLCRSSRYLGLGYYVSLLAEARGHRVIPSVRTLNDLRRKSLYGLDVADLNSRLRRYLPAEGRDATEFSLLVYFGETASGELSDLARQIFEAFPAPILRISFERQKLWQISPIRPVGLAALHDEQEDAFAAALERFSRKMWRKPRARGGAIATTLRCCTTPRNSGRPRTARRSPTSCAPAGRSGSMSIPSPAMTTRGSPNTTPCSFARPRRWIITPTALLTKPSAKAWC